MEVDFEDELYRRLEVERDFNGGFAAEIVKAYRKRMQLIRAAPDERDFYALKSLHFEKLQGNREGQYSMRLNQQWRLVIRFVKKREKDSKLVVIIEVVDYH